MTLISSPPYTFLPAYRPIKYLVMVTAVKLTQLPLNAVVQIFRDGSVTPFAIARFKSSYNEQSTDPSEQDYYFEIDIQKFCQETLAPFAQRPSTFLPKGYGGAISFNDIQGTYNIRIEYEYIDLVTGLLRDDLWSIDLPPDVLVIPATLQHTEVMNLVAYNGTPGLGDGLFLTHSARNLELTRSDDAFLTAYGSAGFVVITYDSAGVITSTSEYLMDISYTRHIGTINTSVESLQTYTPLTGVPDYGPSLASYKIAFMQPFPTELITEYFTYTLIKDCGSRKKLRLHYMNYLGGTDSYTFDGAKDFFIKTESSVTEKALGWVIGSLDPHLISDVGKSKFRSKARQFYKLKSKILTITEAEWLKQLLSSPKVYADINGEFVPVIVEDGEFKIFGDKGKIQLEITVSLANDLIIQR